MRRRGAVTVGRKTHYCDGSRGPGTLVFGRIVNLYVHHKGKWVKKGTICSNCGDHWINGKACVVPRSTNKRPC
jgi:hypothetical protein